MEDGGTKESIESLMIRYAIGANLFCVGRSVFFVQCEVLHRRDNQFPREENKQNLWNADATLMRDWHRDFREDQHTQHCFYLRYLKLMIPVFPSVCPFYTV